MIVSVIVVCSNLANPVDKAAQITKYSASCLVKVGALRTDAAILQKTVSAANLQ
jgi:hypothetical protein